MKIDLPKNSITLDPDTILLTPDNRSFLEIHTPTNHLLSINQPGPLLTGLLRSVATFTVTIPKGVHPFTPDSNGACTGCTENAEPVETPSVRMVLDGEIED
jgi:hypothetical protein